MIKKIGLFLSALFCILSIVACYVVNTKIANGEKQLAAGQKQFDAGQKMLKAGKARLKSGKQQLSAVKGVYGVVDNTPISEIKRVPVAGFLFQHVDKKIASGDQQVAEGEKKVKAGQAKLAAGKIALTEGKKKLEAAKKMLFWLKIATGIFATLFLLFGVFCLKERKTYRDNKR